MMVLSGPPFRVQDLINTEAAYLGYLASESYGLTWKVRGFCKDLSNHDVFTTTNVYGDIKNSDIHHNYYGHYSFGHQGGVWTNNKMHHNHQYGFDPHDDSDYLTIANNDVYDNVNHGTIGCIIPALLGRGSIGHGSLPALAAEVEHTVLFRGKITH